MSCSFKVWNWGAACEPGCRPRAGSRDGPRARLDDLDLVGHAGHAVEAGHVVECVVALVLVVDLALEGDPAVPDVDVDVDGPQVRVPEQALQCDTADLGVLTALVVQQAHRQLVIDLRDARRPPRIGDGRALPAEAADG